MDSPEGTVRIDRWLWAARLFKTRSLATRACAAGQVKCNGVSVKAAKSVHLGDRIDALTPGGPRIVIVLALSETRGPAPVARALYEDRTPPPPPREEGDIPLRARGAGRPTKRDRRLIIRMRGR